MKKNLTIAVIVTLVVLSMAFASTFAPSAFATGTTISTSATATIGGAVFIPSTNVVLSAASVTTQYAVAAQHSSSDPAKGGMQYGATNAGSTILKKIANTSGVPTTQSDASSLSGTGWE